MNNEISINLQNVIENLLPKAISKGLDKAGWIIENDAKRNVGVDTGTLRDSITHVIEDKSCVIGSNVEYAPYHHEKNSFLEDAIDSNMTEIIESFRGLLS